ncbi:HD-like signal output (HDOD) protein [Pseudoduganella flava]|uniref:HD-like signal output (HDOD) protein n=1 Tax=Pseudoduganella flava TaxID=871742 RepID=A0A562PII2_9BURK|nr:HDOD domain-containing protein [Pseudoduganella flava]QGZ37608.1 HDOD domain-containing protein [Pseudoduganella flava]TWI44030.1 HD-like signal output (HDOD) protein [Pseudoduganella flava]
MIESFNAATVLGNQTLALLWERTRRQGDMPAFAKAISAVLGAMRGEEDGQFSMTETVLSDPVLTNKVLRLANSSMYSAFGQHVNTVTKAVLVLGTEAIGHLALGLKLVEELAAASPDSTQAHIEMEKAVLAGLIAREIAGAARSPQTEEAVVCSMLHTLGRMMITFYMPELWTRLRQQAGTGNEDEAAIAVLGLSLADVGIATAQRWGLPRNLVSGMRTVEPAEPGSPLGATDWVATISTLARRCAAALWHDNEAGTAEVRNVAAAYAPMLGLDLARIDAAIEHAKEAALEELTIAPLSKPAERRAKALAKTRQRAAGNKILQSGLADMRDVLDTASPGQMVSMALETVYKGLDFSRAVAFVRNRRENRYSARMCFGDAMKEHLANMAFEDSYEPNVFHAALNSDRVIFIENARDPKFAAKLPHWWKSTLAEARSFVILPLSANGQPAGFLYGDWDETFPPIQLSQTEFALLNDMRALVVKSVERRHQHEMLSSRAA